MHTDREARELVIQIVNELFATGHLTATGGNVSHTSSDGETLWITPSGMYKGGLKTDDLVLIKPDGSVIEGHNRPSIEYQMHFASYRARPGSRGAVHTHSPVATAFGICNQQFLPLNTDAIALADTVTVPWYMPGTKELADAVGEALVHSRGAILQNHGLMAVGESLRKAANRAAVIEETAKIHLYVRQFGGSVSVLPDEWIAKLAPIKDFL
jgi:L-fuculose-phosphate aldolase